MNCTMIYIDEVGYSIGTRRTRGRSRRGRNIVEKIPCLQSPNVSVCAAIAATNGLIYYRPVNGSYTASEFKIFMCELIDLVKRQNIANPLFIFDNCRIHAAAKIDELEAFQVGPQNQHPMQYRFLPPYSPNLNPIENVFSHIKSHFKALIATHYRQELINTFNMPGNQMAERRRILSVAFDQALSEVQNDVQSVTNTFNHLYEFFDKVKQRDI